MEKRDSTVSSVVHGFESLNKGTRLIVTEQSAFLDGYDDAGSRERGTGSVMDALARSLEK